MIDLNNCVKVVLVEGNWEDTKAIFERNDIRNAKRASEWFVDDATRNPIYVYQIKDGITTKIGYSFYGGDDGIYWCELAK